MKGCYCSCVLVLLVVCAAAVKQQFMFTCVVCWLLSAACTELSLLDLDLSFGCCKQLTIYPIIYIYFVFLNLFS